MIYQNQLKMRKLFTLSILLVFIFSGCKKETIQIPEVTVTDFLDYCSTENDNQCGESLKHEGEFVMITCYIQALNTFENQNRFHLFDSTFMSGTRVEVHVIDNEKSIFEKINKHLDNNNVENFSKFRITGKIIGIDISNKIPLHCYRFPFLEIDNPNDIINIDN